MVERWYGYEKIMQHLQFLGLTFFIESQTYNQMADILSRKETVKQECSNVCKRTSTEISIWVPYNLSGDGDVKVVLILLHARNDRVTELSF
jgi:hypothetical protein